ncbi:uncharacterized protein LOC108864710 [Galendromus occidentalis]|uniref:Uncharacterized protein LOC108864710 n=1 Tax=Galendromus occidentalis TaxID=34638 RepID=A0AAJ7L7M0_9ACAR|nr:uncharacterized protein LOC108864710 [Galendromus occidentalis]
MALLRSLDRSPLRAIVYLLLVGTLCDRIDGSEMTDTYVDVIKHSIREWRPQCEDFYGFACVHEDPGFSKVTSYRSRLMRYLDTMAIELLERLFVSYQDRFQTAKVRDSEVQMFKFYQSCKGRHEEDRRRKSVKTIKDLLGDIGIPLGTPHESQSSTAFSALVQLSLIWGVETPLLNFEVKPGLPNNPERIVIQGAKAARTLRRPRLFAAGASPFDDIREEMRLLREDLLRIVGTLQTDEAERLLFVTKNLAPIFELFPFDAPSRAASHFAAVDTFLREVNSNPTSFRNLNSSYVGSFESLERDHKLDWSAALNFNLRFLLQITPESLVEVQNLGYAMAFAEFTLDPRFHDLFTDYLTIWTILHLGAYAGGSLEDAACRINGGPDCEKREDENLHCIYETRMFLPHSYDALIARHLITPRARDAILQNVALQQALIAQLIVRSNWLPSSSKALMIRKLAAMMSYVGHPAHLDDLKGYEHRVVPRRIFLLNIMHFWKASAEYRLTAFYRKYTRSGKIWSILTPPRMHFPEPIYDPGLNAIVIPSMFALFPYYVELDDAVPGVFDFASMGLGIGKALARAFDTENGAVNAWGGDDTGALSWHSNIVLPIRQRMSCFEKSFTKKLTVGGKQLSHTDLQSRDELQADAIAFELLYHGRIHWRSMNHPEKAVYAELAKKLNYTDSQMLYIAATLPSCMRRSTSSVLEAVRAGEPVQALRFEGFLSVNRDFASSFGCRAERPTCSFFTSYE